MWVAFAKEGKVRAATFLVAGQNADLGELWTSKDHELMVCFFVLRWLPINDWFHCLVASSLNGEPLATPLKLAILIHACFDYSKKPFPIRPQLDPVQVMSIHAPHAHTEAEAEATQLLSRRTHAQQQPQQTEE